MPPKVATLSLVLRVAIILVALLHPITSLANKPLRMMSSSPSTKSKKVAVIGATGRLGRQAVLQLASRNVPVKCLVRRYPIDPSAYPSIDKGASSDQVVAYLSSLPGVEFVKGDVTDASSIASLVDGCDAVLALHGARAAGFKSLVPALNPEDDPTHAKQINYVGVRHVIDAAKKSGTCRRIVRVTGKGENPWSVISILINMLGSMAKAWNYEGEQLLRQCGDIDYTIVRPGVMGKDDIPKGKVLALVDDGRDLPVSAVTYEQIASLCVDCLDYPNAARSTLTAMNVEPGRGEETYRPLLEKVKADSRTFPESLLDEHKKAARTGAAILFGVAAVFTQIVWVVGKKIVLTIVSLGH